MHSIGGSSDNRYSPVDNGGPRPLPAPGSNIDIESILKTLIDSQRRTDEKIDRLTALVTPFQQGESEYLTLSETAAIMRHSRYWLSRRVAGNPMWQRLGLTPRKSGRNLLFKKAEVYQAIERLALRHRGRPRK